MTRGNLRKYDAVACFTAGKGMDPAIEFPVPPQHKPDLLVAVSEGLGFVGFHLAIQAFRGWPKEGIDPYVQMAGGDVIGHDEQQEARALVVDPQIPGCASLDGELRLKEEWFVMHHFNPDIHVILALDTRGMTGPKYQRPSYPITWTRLQGKGRVFYTALGHREDVWINRQHQELILGGLRWSLGMVDAQLPANFMQAAPGAGQEMP